MMVTSDNNSDTKQTGLGAQLKSAREALHLSDKEVAARLHLNPRIIQIIETENFNDGPPMIFLRGYIRSYAKLLNLPADEILKALPQVESPIQPVAPVSTPIRKMPTNHAPRHVVRWTTYLVVIVLITLVAIWWMRTHPTTLSLNKNTETPAETIAQNTNNTALAMNNVQAVQSPKSELNPVPGAAVNAKGDISIAGSDPDAPPSNVIQPMASNNATPTQTPPEVAAPQNTNTAQQNSAENTPATQTPTATANNASALPPANSSQSAEAVTPNTLPEPQPSAPSEASAKPAPSESHPEPELAQAKMDLPEPGLEDANQNNSTTEETD